MLSLAFVAWIKQVPDVVAVSVDGDALDESEQPVALPPATTAYVVFPVPVPPEGVKVKSWE